ncbi:MAG: SAM-dependent methyltransferase [Archangiaceae bacterium]|nr:SAM-dependent methyltransferase [Archangiaceae bacterium]
MNARRQVVASRVRRELLPEQSTALLKELHLLTRDGRLNADSLRKLKQVNHLVGLLTPALDDVQQRFGQPVVVDVGSGNAYLGFVLYELFMKEKGEVLSIESRADLSTKAGQRAKTLGFDRMKFETGSIAAASYPERIHLLTALHSCDTATDDAIAVALKHNADHLALVPCCQAEVAQQLKESSRESPMKVLFEHPIHRREFGSHLTNVLRALTLEAHGYSVTVTELTGWEHSLKNELILAKKVRAQNPEARARLEALLQQTGVKPRRLPLPV